MKNKSVRIVDIARLANVSPGTVDRVLHNRGKVSQEKRESIEKAVKELNYEPNMVARFLASKRSYNFIAITPSFNPGDYWELVCSGINKAAKELSKFNVEVEFVHFDQYDRKSFETASRKVLESECDGVIVATLFGEFIPGFSARLDEQEIPYVYIDCNIDRQNNLTYLGADSYVSGRIAAKLMLDVVGLQASICFVHIKFKYAEISVQMRTREEGFMDYLSQKKFEGKIRHFELDPARPEKCRHELEKLLQCESAKAGAIVLNSRIYELVALTDDMPEALRSKLMLIGHDAIESNVTALKQNKIAYLISQQTDRQGADAVKVLANYLLFNQQPEKNYFMPIDILIQDNVDYYNNYKL